MRTDIVFTLTGKDRIGIVDEVSEVLLDLGGNVGTSRMARLGGEFAILMLVTLPAERAAELDAAFAHLVSQGYKVTASRTESTQERAEWPFFRIQVQGADHEGIVHEIAHGLSSRGINIESMETGTTRAPMSGATLFTMSALVAVPPGLDEGELRMQLGEAGRQSNVDIDLTKVERP